MHNHTRSNCGLCSLFVWLTIRTSLHDMTSTYHLKLLLCVKGQTCYAKDGVGYENTDSLLVNGIHLAKHFYYRKLIYFFINMH